MITRIGRNDVVRVTRTGEVGTVKGWADHERLDQHGTIIDVEVSHEKVIQVNGLALELVALAKLKSSKLAQWTVIVLSMGASFWMTLTLLNDGVNGTLAGVIGGSMYPTFERLLTALFLRKRSRVTLPKTSPQDANK